MWGGRGPLVMWRFTTKSTVLRGVLLADLFELLVPGGSAIVRFLPEPGDDVYVHVRVDPNAPELQGTHKAGVWLEPNSPCLPALWSVGTWNTYKTRIPLGQVEFVDEEVPHASLIHFFLQYLQEVDEPLKGVCFPAEPIEIDLRPGNRCRLNNNPLTNGRPCCLCVMSAPNQMTNLAPISQPPQAAWWNNRFNYLPGAQFGVGFLEFVPDRLEDGGEGSDSDASADQHADFIVKHVLAGCTKRAVHAHSEENNKVTVSPGSVWKNLWKVTKQKVS